MILKNSGAFDQEAAVGGSALDGEPAVSCEDGSRVDLHSPRRERRYLEGHPICRNEGQLHIDYS